jgi:hypothetical protein
MKKRKQDNIKDNGAVDMEKMRIVVYGYSEVCYHFPKINETARSNAIKVLELSSSVPEDILEKYCKKKNIRFFKDGTYFNETGIMNRCDYNGYTYEDHVRDIVQDALNTYSEGYTPRREELFAKSWSIDGFLDACKLSEAIIKLGDKCEQDTRKKEKINCAADSKAGNFYYHTVLFRTYLVTSVTNEGVNYMSSGYEEEPIYTEFDGFIKYFVSLPDTKSFDY